MKAKSNVLPKVNIKDLANYLVLKYEQEGNPLTPLKLQKLLYYVQAWHIVFFDKHPLFDELPEAWAFGPVYRSVYDTYKKKWFKNSVINSKFKTSEELGNQTKLAYKKLGLNTKQKDYLNHVLNSYSILTPEYLVVLTHTEKPYLNAREGYDIHDICTNTITIEDMYDFYTKKRKNGKK